MKKKSKIILAISLAILPLIASAQYPGQPTYHDSYANFYFMGGYQHLMHPSEAYNVGTIQAEMIYSFFGSRVGMTFGPDYFSFSPFGILLFMPKIYMDALNGGGGNEAALILLAAGFSAAQWHFPLTDHLEIHLGWDALKFTKLKNISDTYYLTGSLNAGLIYFLNDNLFVSGYYEFNHTHNGMASFLRSIIGDASITREQPTELKGHSFGVRLGWML